MAPLAAATALVFSAAPAAQAATSAPVSHQVSQSPAQVRAYWTPQRMRSAEPVDSPEVAGPSAAVASVASTDSQASGRAVEIHPTYGKSTYAYEPGSETSFPQRVHGKIFFTVPTQGDFACSGTLVASLLRNVVVTAGHCVDDPDVQQWSTNLIFIPALSRWRRTAWRPPSHEPALHGRVDRGRRSLLRRGDRPTRHAA